MQAVFSRAGQRDGVDPGRHAAHAWRCLRYAHWRHARLRHARLRHARLRDICLRRASNVLAPARDALPIVSFIVESYG
ncbi:pentapeptide repeat-containing protein [Janthinobacterium sp. Mn2066]|uniref:pentapeptide repeat-containing protein n=1 Tax=Janthinobacterium sp. Mn2066 TaxID=3395264 RepID=UPI003BBF0B16